MDKDECDLLYFASIRGHYSLRTGVGSGEGDQLDSTAPPSVELTPEWKAVKAY
jgi:hypothetical protein